MKKQLRIHKIISSLLISSAVAGTGISAIAADEDENIAAPQSTEAVSDGATADEATEAESSDEGEEASGEDESSGEDEATGDDAGAGEDAADSADEPSDEGEASGETPAAPQKSGPSFDEVAQTRRAIYAEARAALDHVDELIFLGELTAAEKYLDDIEIGLPKTPTSKEYLDRCDLARKAIETHRSEAQSASAHELTDSERAKVRENVLAARRLLDRGRTLRSQHDLAGALRTLQEAKRVLPELYSANSIRQEINEEIARVYSVHFYQMVEARSAVEAASYLKMVGDLLGEKHKMYRQLNAFYEEWRKTNAAQNPKTLNPGFVRSEEAGFEALRRAKAQYLYGDYHGALASYGEALLHMPDDQEAKTGQIRIRKVLANSGQLNRELTRSLMFSDVDEKWRMAQPFSAAATTRDATEKEDPLVAKMSRIKIPVSFSDTPLQRALDTLVELSETYDPVGRGVQIVLNDPNTKDRPTINLRLKDQPLTRVLDTMLKNVNYRYDVKDGIVEVSPDTGSANLEYEEFDIPPKVAARMAGRKAIATGGGFGSSGSEATSEDNAEEEGIKSFLARAGVSWEGDRGLVYDADSNKLIVMQDSKGMTRVRHVLQSLSTAETKQVNIEAKFIEVNSTALNQLTSNWALTDGEGETMFTRATTNNRTVADAHASVSSDSKTTIYTPPSDIYDDDGNVVRTTDATSYEVSQAAPAVTRQPNYGYGMLPTFTGVIGTIGDYDLRLVLNAISAMDGTDLMAAPSLTVQSEMEATIKIVQLLRWPQSYDDMEIQVSSSSSSSNYNDSSWGASSVGITPGTPQFDEDATEVGIQMTVTPRVNNSESTISMELSPEIVEFEGFIEYGGTAVAIASNTVVTTPAGFFQPVFNKRQVTTTVEVYDGATLVIGGLTREEVRSVNDKVPVLGDLPLIGAAFRSTGKSITKKNLLIFVTANLMARGGGTEEGLFRGVQKGATYSNPSYFISAGPIYREYDMNANTEGEEEGKE